MAKVKTFQLPFRPNRRRHAGVAGALGSVMLGSLTLGFLVLGLVTWGWATPAAAKQDPRATAAASDANLLLDPAAPTAGNPDGDVTIVAFTDYNCPYCRKSDDALAALIASDPKVKVVYKDWPILAKSSLMAAKVAIAAQWQGKYQAVHESLMKMNARPARDSDISQAVAVAGVDVERLNRDLDSRDGEIVALLKRTIVEANSLGFPGTPVYVIGPFVMAQPLDEAGFREAVSAARKAEPRASQTR